MRWWGIFGQMPGHTFSCITKMDPGTFAAANYANLIWPAIEFWPFLFMLLFINASSPKQDSLSQVKMLHLALVYYYDMASFVLVLPIVSYSSMTRRRSEALASILDYLQVHVPCSPLTVIMLECSLLKLWKIDFSGECRPYLKCSCSTLSSWPFWTLTPNSHSFLCSLSTS